MSKMPRLAREKQPVYREPWCLVWFRMCFCHRVRKTMRMTNPDRYNDGFMEPEIRAVENLALDHNRRRHEANLMKIPQRRGRQLAKLEEYQAIQCMVYDALKKVREDLEKLDAETAAAGGK